MKFQITIFQIISICVVVGVSILIYFLTKPNSTITPTTTDDSAVIAKKVFLDERLKNILGKSDGYKANKENVFNAIDTAFKEDALKFCKCMMDFIKKYSDKSESDIVLYTTLEEFMETFTSILSKNPSIALPNCQINLRQLNFLFQFLNEITCYPDINQLITWIKKHINSTYRADEITTTGNITNNNISLSSEEEAFYTVFLTSQRCSSQM